MLLVIHNVTSAYFETGEPYKLNPVLIWVHLGGFMHTLKFDGPTLYPFFRSKSPYQVGSETRFLSSMDYF